MLRRQRLLRSQRAPRPGRPPPNAGVAALEFALITPVFLIALAGVVDLGGEIRTGLCLRSSSATALQDRLDAGSFQAPQRPQAIGNLAEVLAG